MKETRSAICIILSLLFLCMPCILGAEHESKSRERVLDRKVHIEDEIVLEIPYVPRLCDTMDIPHQRIDVEDCKLYCEVEGEGTPLVLLHGGPGATHHYFHPHFSQAREFARVVYYDQRGCGLSDYKPGKGYSLEQAIEDLEQLRKALNLEKWVLLGHSYGGFLAQCYSMKYPERAAGLVLVCASTGMKASLGTRQYDFLSKREKEKIQQIHSNKQLTTAQSVYNAFLNGDWKRQSFYKPTKEAVARVALYEWVHDTHFRSALCRDIYNFEDMEGLFDHCPIPTLIMEGQWDLTWGKDKARLFHENHPHSRLILFEQSSHSPFEDEPEKFFQALKLFLNELPQVKREDIDQWKQSLRERKVRLEKDPDHIVLNDLGWGRKSNEKLVTMFSDTWQAQLRGARSLFKMGFAFYDLKRYEEALTTFQKCAESAKGNKMYQAQALIWQGHTLDLLNQREQAISTYKKAFDMNINSPVCHDQFGLRYSISAYAKKRMKEPFTRLENLDND